MGLCWEGKLGVLSTCHVPGLDSLDATTKNVSRRCHVSPKVGRGVEQNCPLLRTSGLKGPRRHGGLDGMMPV